MGPVTSKTQWLQKFEELSGFKSRPQQSWPFVHVELSTLVEEKEITEYFTYFRSSGESRVSLLRYGQRDLNHSLVRFRYGQLSPYGVAHTTDLPFLHGQL